MKVGIIGAGSMGNAHAPGWVKTGANIVGVVSADSDATDRLASQIGAKSYATVDSLLADIDIVDICAPTHLHHDLVMQAAKAGKHIICEKPIALSVDNGLEMIRACEDAGVRLFIGMVIHFFPEYIAIKNAINNGSIGNPQVIRMTRASYRPQRPADDWFMNESKSGGMVVDLMIHDFEMSRWLAKSEVTRVFARSIRSQHPEILEDHSLVVLRFANGAMAHIEGSWTYPKGMFSVRVEVAGDNGLIEWDNDRTMPIQALMHQHDNGTLSDVALPGSPLAESPWETEVQHFYDAIIHDKPFRITPLDALKGLQIALAAQESNQTGQPITLKSLEV